MMYKERERVRTPFSVPENAHLFLQSKLVSQLFLFIKALNLAILASIPITSCPHSPASGLQQLTNTTPEAVGRCRNISSQTVLVQAHQ
jgi:hypothetical protein